MGSFVVNASSKQEQESINGQKRKGNFRHSAEQIQDLETFFKFCPNPNDQQRRMLSRELGLESHQIKFWFQNKRTQTKVLNERATNFALKEENEKIKYENLAMKDSLKNLYCPSCKNYPIGEEEHQSNLDKLMTENSQLKEELKSVTVFLNKYME